MVGFGSVTENLIKYNTNYKNLTVCLDSGSSIVFKNTNILGRYKQANTNLMGFLSKGTENKSRLYSAYSILKNFKRKAPITNNKYLKYFNFLNIYRYKLSRLALFKRLKLIKLFKSKTKIFNFYNNLNINKIFKLLNTYKIVKLFNLLQQSKSKPNSKEKQSLGDIRHSKAQKRKRNYYKNIIIPSRIAQKHKDVDLLGQEVINTLKTKVKFHQNLTEILIGSTVFFKYTGSNIYITITTKKGDVLNTYSSGFFEGLRTRKEKTTVFVSKQLGVLLAIRLYKLNARESIFIPFLNNRKARTLLRFLLQGLRVIKPLKFVRIYIKINVMRNGVRLRKAPRK